MKNNTMLPKVAVIILNFNNWQDTINCIKSLGNIDYPNYDIILVDNGSTDNSIEKINFFYPQINLIETNKNLGFGGGCNAGIKKALKSDYEYIWLLNNDTIADRQSLKELIKVAQSNSKIGLVSSVLYEFENPSNIQVFGGGYVNCFLGFSMIYKKPTEAKGKNIYLTAASLLLNKKALESVGLFDENSFFMYWEDVDLSFRMIQKGWQLEIADKSKVLHKGSATMGKNNILKIVYYNTSAVRFFKKNCSYYVIPIIFGTLLRFVKKLITGKIKEAIAVLKGAAIGIK
jgi:GT2 family glycosyltransferase